MNLVFAGDCYFRLTIDQDEDARFMNMQVLLEKSSIFTEVLKDQMDRTREKHAAVAATTQTRPTKARQKQRGARHSGRRASGRGKRVRLDSDDEDQSEGDGDEPQKRARVLPQDAKPAFVQPALLTGATLKDYQLEGVAWMVSLWENGISGILGESSLRWQLFVALCLIDATQRMRWALARYVHPMPRLACAIKRSV
jgi:ATP-dependent DNA helicase